MTEICLETLIPSNVLEHMSPDEKKWFSEIFSRFGGRYPNLEQLWKLMDEPWAALGCDHDVMDDRIRQYYMHPVWLLNGLFIEQHDLSLNNREEFSKWVALQKPRRIADYGGGYGGLARMIGKICPDTVVEIIEPHPHPAAIALTGKTSNVSYRPELTGEYDVLIATDVFEHVPDPLLLAFQTAGFLKHDGLFLFGNCFSPVIRCHLPQTFHFRYTWAAFMRRLGLVLEERVVYGDAYRKSRELDFVSAKELEKKSNALFFVTKNIHGRLAKLLSDFLIR